MEPFNGLSQGASSSSNILVLLIITKVHLIASLARR